MRPNSGGSRFRSRECARVQEGQSRHSIQKRRRTARRGDRLQPSERSAGPTARLLAVRVPDLLPQLPPLFRAQLWARSGSSTPRSGHSTGRRRGARSRRSARSRVLLRRQPLADGTPLLRGQARPDPRTFLGRELLPQLAPLLAGQMVPDVGGAFGGRDRLARSCRRCSLGRDGRRRSRRPCLRHGGAPGQTCCGDRCNQDSHRNSVRAPCTRSCHSTLACASALGQKSAQAA
jgi:hypothetical protein